MDATLSRGWDTDELHFAVGPSSLLMLRVGLLGSRVLKYEHRMKQRIRLEVQSAEHFPDWSDKSFSSLSMRSEHELRIMRV